MKKSIKTTIKSILFLTVASGAVMSPILASHFTNPSIENFGRKTNLDLENSSEKSVAKTGTLINGVDTNTAGNLTVKFLPFLYLNYFNKKLSGYAPVASVDFANKTTENPGVYVSNPKMYLSITNDYDQSTYFKESKNNVMVAMNSPEDELDKENNISSVVLLDTQKSSISSDVFNFSTKEVKVTFDVNKISTNETWHVEKTLAVAPECTGGIIINQTNNDFLLSADKEKNILKNFGSVSMLTHGLPDSELELKIVSKDGYEADDILEANINPDKTFDLKWKGTLDAPTDLNYKFQIVAVAGKQEKTLLPVYSDEFNLNVVSCLKEHADKVISSNSKFIVNVDGTVINNISTIYLNTRYYEGLEEECFGSFFESEILTGSDNLKSMTNTAYNNLRVSFSKMSTDRYDVTVYPESEWTVLSVNAWGSSSTSAPYFIDSEGYGRFTLEITTPYSTFSEPGFNFKFVNDEKGNFLGAKNSSNELQISVKNNQVNENELTFWNSTNSGGYKTSLEDDKTAYKNYYVVDQQSHKRLSGWAVEDKLQTLVSNSMPKLSGYSASHNLSTTNVKTPEFRAFFFSHVNGEVKVEIAPYSYFWDVLVIAIAGIAAVLTFTTLMALASACVAGVVGIGVAYGKDILQNAAILDGNRISPNINADIAANFNKAQATREFNRTLWELDHGTFTDVQQMAYELQIRHDFSYRNGVSTFEEAGYTLSEAQQKMIAFHEDNIKQYTKWIQEFNERQKIWEKNLNRLEDWEEINRCFSGRRDLAKEIAREKLKIEKINLDVKRQMGKSVDLEPYSTYNSENQVNLSRINKLEKASKSMSERDFFLGDGIVAHPEKSGPIKKYTTISENAEELQTSMSVADEGVQTSARRMTSSAERSPTGSRSLLLGCKIVGAFMIALAVALTVIGIINEGKIEGGVKATTCDDNSNHKSSNKSVVPNYGERNLLVSSEPNAEMPSSGKIQIIADAFTDKEMDGMNNPDYATQGVDLCKSVFTSAPINVEVKNQQVSEHDLTATVKNSYSAIIEKQLSPGLNKDAGSIYFNDNAAVTPETEITAEICDLSGRKIRDKGWGISVHGNDKNRRYFDLVLPSTIDESNFYIKVYRKQYINGVSVNICKSNMENIPINSVSYFSEQKQVSYNIGNDITDTAISPEFLKSSGLEKEENPYKVFACEQDAKISNILRFNSQLPFSNGNLNAVVLDGSNGKTLSNWTIDTQTTNNKEFTFSLLPPKNFSGKKLIEVLVYNGSEVVFSPKKLTINVNNELTYNLRSESLDLEKGQWNEIIDVRAKYSESDSLEYLLNSSVLKYIVQIFGEEPKIKILKDKNNSTKVYLWVPENIKSGITIYCGLSIFENKKIKEHTDIREYRIK